MRGSRKLSQGGVQIPRRGLTENFNMAKINNLAIPGGGGSGPPVPPLDLPMCDFLLNATMNNEPESYTLSLSQFIMVVIIIYLFVPIDSSTS